jgi:Tfp pilus assembly protein PilF
MSILANLLKKAETNQTKGEIPPGLLQTVRASSGSDTGPKKYLLLGGLSLAALVVGGLLALYLGRRAVVHPPVVQQPVQQPVVVAVQKPVSSVVHQEPLPQTTAVKPPVVASEPVKSGIKPRPRQMHAAYAAKRTTATHTTTAATPEKKSVVRDRETIDALLFAARSAEARREYTVALKQYQKALDADPLNYRIMNNVASTLLQLGANDEALIMANRTLAIKPDYPSVMVNAGIALGRLGHEGAARGMFSKAVALDPTNRSALFSLALAQERAGLQDDALASYRRLADAGDARGLMGQGRMNERSGNKGEALKFYRELTALPDAGQKLKESARERIVVLDR